VQVRGYGLEASLPAGWEGVLRAAPPSVREPGEVGPMGADPDAGGDVRPGGVFHAGTFGLPSERGDFGSGAVELMRDEDTFVALLEYDPEEAGTALFAAEGLPRRLDPRRFSESALQRAVAGQAGYQHFFTEAGRAFCLYVVLGDVDDRLVQVRRVEQMLANIRIEPGRGAAPSRPAPDEADPEDGDEAADPGAEDVAPGEEVELDLADDTGAAVPIPDAADDAATDDATTEETP
jgi:hypothetical protein